MANFFLQEGLVIAWEGEHLECVGCCGDELYFEQPETGHRQTFREFEFWSRYQTGALTIVRALSSPTQLIVPDETTPQADPMALVDAPEHYQEEALRRLKYIDKLREAGCSIGQKHLIEVEAKRIAAEMDDELRAPSTSSLRRWWRTYRTHGYDAAALLNKNAIKRRAQRLNVESEQFVQSSIDLHYMQLTRPSARFCYAAYSDEVRTENRVRLEKRLPTIVKVSERTYYSRIDARDKYETHVARYGLDSARRHFKMAFGHLPASYPLDAVEIDHTPLNLFVLDDIVFLPLGRPWLTAIKDRYSKILLGFYVSFQPTGLGSIFGAIKHSLHSHQAAHKVWSDLQNPWPAHGRGALYVSDRGADFKSRRYRTAIVSLGAKYEHCEHRAPWLKGSIERFFLTLDQTLLEAMHGKTFSSLAERGVYQPEKEAVIRFTTLIYLLHKWAVDVHNITPHSRMQASPIELWNEGIGIAPPPYPANVDNLNIILGERRTGALSHEGIRYLGLNYASHELADLRRHVGRNKRIDYAVCREDLSHIHVKNPENHAYFRVPCTRPDYTTGLSLYQHTYLRKRARAEMEESAPVDVLMRTRLEVAQRIGEEVDRKSNAVKLRLARAAGVNSNSVLEGKTQSITTAFEGQAEEAQLATQAAVAPITDVPHLSWGV